MFFENQYYKEIFRVNGLKMLISSNMMPNKVKSAKSHIVNGVCLLNVDCIELLFFSLNNYIINKTLVI